MTDHTTTTAPSSAPTVAVLGIGLMGLPIARRLCEAGLAVRAWNRTPDKAERLLPFGATVCETPADAVSRADLVILTREAPIDMAFAQLSPDPRDGERLVLALDIRRPRH